VNCSRAFGSGLLFVDPGTGAMAVGTAIDPTGKGDVSNTHVKWQTRGGPEAAGCSPIIVGDHVYRAGNPGIKCWKLADGELVDEKRLARVFPCSSLIATPDGRIYIAGANPSWVIKAGPPMEILATNDLPCQARPGPPANLSGRKRQWESLPGGRRQSQAYKDMRSIFRGVPWASRPCPSTLRLVGSSERGRECDGSRQREMLGLRHAG
jgi:hypothetical protein